ncbi:MAG: hypothetical protein M3545_15550 [Acidobacteriota bacterium]|nr:hypothetical protein [Acidobacteriota bacterium]
MPHKFTRRALYDLVWSEPMQAVAKRFSLSDRGIAKICAAANIPVPTRGYWAKLQAGKEVQRQPLPARALGQSDEISFGRGAWPNSNDSDRELLASPIPPLPVFEPEMDVVRLQAIALVRKALLPLRDTHGWHSQVGKLLAADEERARKQRASPYPSTGSPRVNTSDWPSATSLENAQDFLQVLVPSRLSPLIRPQSCGNLKPSAGTARRLTTALRARSCASTTRSESRRGAGHPRSGNSGGPTPAVR